MATNTVDGATDQDGVVYGQDRVVVPAREEVLRVGVVGEEGGERTALHEPRHVLHFDL